MKNLFFILLVLMLAACQTSTDELATPDPVSQLDSRSATRVFKGSFYSTMNVSSTPTACSGDLQGLALFDYNLSGTATHMGNLVTDLSTLHHDDCDLSFETASLTTGLSGQLAAANGDLIYYAGDDVINVFNLLTQSGPTGSIDGTWTITGGTGKFDDASGSLTITGVVDFTTLEITIEANGTITY